MNPFPYTSRTAFFAALARIGLLLPLLAGLLFLAPGVSAIDLGAPSQPKPRAYMVRDIRPGETGASFPGVFYAAGRTLYFSTDDGVHGYELWKSDGTAAGTVLVKDIYPGRYSSFMAGNMAQLKEIVYFTANDGMHGEELWRSDGTAAGTQLVKDIYPGKAGSNARYLTPFGGLLIFTADDGTNGSELWRSDGTAVGTQLVKDICPGSCPSISWYSEETFPIIGDFLLFGANDGALGNELWRSDGTAAGTQLVKDLYPGYGSGMEEYIIRAMGVLNGVLFFPGTDGATGYELWKSDGTEAGTQLVKDIRPGYNSSYLRNITMLNDAVFFAADDGVVGQELWRSDGSEAGTVLVKDIFQGPEGADINSYDWRPLVTLNGRLYFAAQDANHGLELWWSDGTEAGTELLVDLYPGMAGSYPEFLTAVNGKLYFVASDLSIFDRRYFLSDAGGPYGSELWSLAYFTYLPSIRND